ncbi:MAG: OsmC family protein [Candidatus Izemoplasmataceae bacterium]
MATHVKMVFDNQTNGVLSGSHGSAKVGGEDGALAAYDMVLGGLGACLNHTFQSILDKKKIGIHGVNYDIEGVKRDDVPATLKTVHIEVTVSGADEAKEKQLRKSWELATRYCSMHVTLAKVADMSSSLTLK